MGLLDQFHAGDEYGITLGELAGGVRPPRGLLGVDLSRPKIQNNDGSFSTERTITVEAGGRHYLIPTIVSGAQLTPDMAILAWRVGDNPAVGEFASAREADSAAVARSKMIGKLRVK